MGASICNLSIAMGNTICFNDSLPIGSQNITKDISIVTQTDLDSAEDAKMSYASLLTKSSDQKQIALPHIGTTKTQQIALSKINEIAKARVEETLLLLKKMLSKSGYKDKIEAGIVLTGGMTKMEGFLENCQSYFYAHTSADCKTFKCL